MSGQRQDFCRADSIRIVSFISAQVPFYTIHKILAGLVDACRYTINNLALDIAIIAILAGPAGENGFHLHPMGNMLKTIDFIGVFELHGSKKRHIPSQIAKKRQKRPILESF